MEDVIDCMIPVALWNLGWGCWISCIGLEGFGVTDHTSLKKGVKFFNELVHLNNLQNNIAALLFLSVA